MRKYLLPASLGLNLLLLVGLTGIVQALGGIPYMLFKVTHRGASGWRDHKAKMFTMLPDTEGEILFVGNSITEGCEWAELFGNPKIKNRGIGGETSSQILDRIDELISSKPRKIFFMMGINDLVTFAGTSTVLENYEQVIQKIQTESPGTKLYLQSVLPVNNGLKDTYRENDDVLSINLGLQELAKKYQLTYVNLHSHFLNSEDKLDGKFSVDGIHINGEGYMVWKRLVEPYVNE